MEHISASVADVYMREIVTNSLVYPQILTEVISFLLTVRSHNKFLLSTLCHGYEKS